MLLVKEQIKLLRYFYKSLFLERFFDVQCVVI